MARRNRLGNKPKVIRIPKIGNIMDRVVVGITGASGIPYGIRLLEVLREFDVEVHLTCSPSASLVNKHEGDGRSWDEVLALADVLHDNDKIVAVSDTASSLDAIVSYVDAIST